MCSCFRKSDLLGRFGGEEFAVIITGGDEKEILNKMELFRTKVSQTPINITSSHHINLTVSIGLAFLDTSNNSFTGLLKLADTALYQAKNSGRNRVSVYKR